MPTGIEIVANIKSDTAKLMRVISKGSLVLFAYNKDRISEVLRAMPKLQITRFETLTGIEIFVVGR